MWEIIANNFLYKNNNTKNWISKITESEHDNNWLGWTIMLQVMGLWHGVAVWLQPIQSHSSKQIDHWHSSRVQITFIRTWNPTSFNAGRYDEDLAWADNDAAWDGVKTWCHCLAATDSAPFFKVTTPSTHQKGENNFDWFPPFQLCLEICDKKVPKIWSDWQEKIFYSKITNKITTS